MLLQLDIIDRSISTIVNLICNYTSDSKSFSGKDEESRISLFSQSLPTYREFLKYGGQELRQLIEYDAVFWQELLQKSKAIVPTSLTSQVLNPSKKRTSSLSNLKKELESLKAEALGLNKMRQSHGNITSVRPSSVRSSNSK